VVTEGLHAGFQGSGPGGPFENQGEPSKLVIRVTSLCRKEYGLLGMEGLNNVVFTEGLVCQHERAEGKNHTKRKDRTQPVILSAHRCQALPC
jgi:hypothetical protein